MNNKYWYAIMMDNEDTDWGFGSSSLEEAKKMLEQYRADYPDSYIAVIDDNDDPICIDIIR